MQDEPTGSVTFRVIANDGSAESMILLTGLKNIYQKQLPNMPKEYIARLVYDRSHRSMAVVRDPLTVVGGITYKPFASRKFAEIVFCAIASTEQVKVGISLSLYEVEYDQKKKEFIKDIGLWITFDDPCQGSCQGSVRY